MYTYSRITCHLKLYFYFFAHMGSDGRLLNYHHICSVKICLFFVSVNLNI